MSNRLTPDTERCYMCSSAATSREHVPPRCLFPKSADTGFNFRQRLITVPSCDLHNTRKAQDDEFLMVSLAGILGNNSIGYSHRLGKVNRAVLRSSRRLLDAAFVSKQSHFVAVDENKFLEIIWGTPDVARLQRCFDRIARGLHRHHFGMSFDGEVRTHLGYLAPKPGNASTFRDFIKHRVEIDLIGIQHQGDNPGVFSYRFSEPDSFGYYLVEMRFYGGVIIYCAYVPATLGRPSYLPALLIEKGVRTILNLEGKQYEFNAQTQDSISPSPPSTTDDDD